MDKKIKLSVVMPTMNEEKAIAKVISDIQKYSAPYDLELLIVDSSVDKTPEIAESMGARVIKQPPQGPGKALILGIQNSTGQVVITSDCDDTYPMEDIPRFINYWENGYHFINGSRMNPSNISMPKFNRFGNWVFAFLVRNLYKIQTSDITTGMRLFSRQLIDSHKWETNYSFWAEILIKSHQNGFKYIEIPIKYRLRLGEVKLNVWRSGIAFIKCIFKYRFNLSFIDPKKL